MFFLEINLAAKKPLIPFHGIFHFIDSHSRVLWWDPRVGAHPYKYRHAHRNAYPDSYANADAYTLAAGRRVACA